jgi:pimeloyl-ACP methyl ester carboxylesterase
MAQVNLWQRRQLLGTWAILICLVCLNGCASIGVRRIVRPDLLAYQSISPEARLLLGGDRPDKSALIALLNNPETESDPAKLLATAEVAYHIGRSAQLRSANEACHWYVTSARQSYLMLGRTDATDEQVQRSRDIYNGAVAQSLRLALKTGTLNPQSQLVLPGSGGVVPVEHLGFVRDVGEFGKVELCDDLQVVGIERGHRFEGIGVPVLIHRQVKTPSEGKHYSPDLVSFAATVVLHFDGGAKAPTRVQLANSMTVSTTVIRGQEFALSADFTTPLASTVSQTQLDLLAYVGFLHSESVREYSGICMLEPYQPGKIPVIFVHGLASSPITWAPLFNDLLADPALRDRYQFWSYFYPTGDPFPTSAADFRESLVQLRKDLDPEHQDPAFDQMVLLGHSMGGLLCKMMTIDGGDDLFRIVSEKPFDSLNLSPKVAAELRRAFYFERQPSVKRVVFIATPHHGSSLSPGLPGQIANRVVHLRSSLAEASREMILKIPDLPGGRVPTSVELLAPDSRALKILLSRSPAADVTYHSIIGILPKADGTFAGLHCKTEDQTDGVVSYASAHLDGVQSEVLVPSEHVKVHQAMETTKEVRRILLSHLEGLAEPETGPELEMTNVETNLTNE